ncbi:MAG: phytoene desaturase family protein [Flavobacteriales bacterium]|nr:phytoene desaturase family protein [Flavobacteriales bacterium]MDG1781100.1 phytoene desaturase family protein [Flavobacteriales bacterium]MDG2246525.1 phytoene desaturase family protein [Flavobacteriales bacterium]
MSKVVVIGAGIAGLATAVRLQAKGHKVTVIEQADGPGGKLREKNDGSFRFDLGPSLFTLPELVQEVLALGDLPATPFPFEKLDRSCHYFWEDGSTLVAFEDKKKLAKEVEEKLNGKGEEVLEHLMSSAFLYKHTAKLFMHRSLHKLSSYLSKTVLQALVRVHKFNLTTTLHEVNQKRFSNPKLVQLFDRYATYNGSDPYRAPGVLNIIPHLEHNIGTFFPAGGMFQISNSIYQRAKELGVTFQFNTRCEEIRIEKNRVQGVRTATEEIAADVVVSNADVHPTYRHLLPNIPAPEKTLQSERSSSAIIFYWGIKGSFDNLHLHNILFSEDYRGEFEQLFKGTALHPDPTVYINITSKCKADDAPAGQENWFVMINAPANKGQDWEAWIPQAKEFILNKIERTLKRSIRELIVVEDILDPRGIEKKTSSFMGALYGTSSNDRMAAFLRHPNFSQQLKGLYFCGGSVHPGGGIPLCLLSAKIVDELIPNA